MDGHNKNRDALSSESEKERTLPAKSVKGQPLSAGSESKVYESIRFCLVDARIKAFNVINSAMVQAYWEIGREISEAVSDRAGYGKQLLQYLSQNLTAEFGKGFTVANLRQFYHTFPIRYAMRSELTWTHYRMLMRIDEPKRREFYLKESPESGWTSRQLERQINSFYEEDGDA